MTSDPDDTPDPGEADEPHVDEDPDAATSAPAEAESQAPGELSADGVHEAVASSADAGGGEADDERTRRLAVRVALLSAGFALLTAGVVVVVAWGSDDDGIAGDGGSAVCEDAGYVADEDAGLCYRLPEGWSETEAEGEEVEVSSMIMSSVGDPSGSGDAPASAMTGEWQMMFESAAPGDSPEDAARWMVGESGLWGGNGEDVSSEAIDVDGYAAATATGEIPGEPAIRLQATVVEASEDVVFLLTLAPAAADTLVAATEDIHDSLAVSG